MTRTAPDPVRVLFHAEAALARGLAAVAATSASRTVADTLDEMSAAWRLRAMAIEPPLHALRADAVARGARRVTRLCRGARRLADAGRPRRTCEESERALAAVRDHAAVAAGRAAERALADVSAAHARAAIRDAARLRRLRTQHLTP